MNVTSALTCIVFQQGMDFPNYRVKILNIIARQLIFESYGELIHRRL